MYAALGPLAPRRGLAGQLAAEGAAEQRRHGIHVGRLLLDGAEGAGADPLGLAPLVLRLVIGELRRPLFRGRREEHDRIGNLFLVQVRFHPGERELLGDGVPRKGQSRCEDGR